jgi:hypothetical protein
MANLKTGSCYLFTSSVTLFRNSSVFKKYETWNESDPLPWVDLEKTGPFLVIDSAEDTFTSGQEYKILYEREIYFINFSDVQITYFLDNSHLKFVA